MIQKIVCVLRSGGGFENDHVERLYRMCYRHIPGRWSFHCLADKVGAPGATFDAGNILYHQMDPILPGWWGKMQLFGHPMFNTGDRVLYLDLDTVIVRDSNLGMWEGQLALLRDLWTLDRFNTGVMAWKADSWQSKAIQISFEAFFNYDGADGDFINDVLSQGQFNPETIQDIDPGVVSVKPQPGDHDHLRHDLDGTETVVCFHGKPRPWDFGAPWVAEHYR